MNGTTAAHTDLPFLCREMRGEASLPVIRAISVDDSPVVAERMEQMLEDLSGVEFLGHAVNIPEALDLVKEEKPEVVILDIHLEKDLPLNGMDLLITLKKRHPEMKIIMLTNLSQPQYRDACLRLGADYFLDKTHDFEMIPDILGKIRIDKAAIPDRDN